MLIFVYVFFNISSLIFMILESVCLWGQGFWAVVFIMLFFYCNFTVYYFKMIHNYSVYLIIL